MTMVGRSGPRQDTDARPTAGTAPLPARPILVCHNYYQQKGGEDESFDAEVRLLASHGHEVVPFTVHNDEIAQMSTLDVAARTVWNRRAHRHVRDLIRQHRPAVMHCTNTFPLMSPAIYHAARKEGVPVIQSIRNYRLRCVNGLLLRQNRPCERCLTKAIPWPGVVHGCYRNSRAASAVVASMLGVHRVMGTWTRAVDVYVALTEFARSKLVEAGLAAERIVVKPNFVDPDPGPGMGAGHFAVFAGRLSAEKGIETMLEAWSHPNIGMPLKLIGDGPLAGRVRQAAACNPNIQWLGRRPLLEVHDTIGDATLVVMPSECYETFGRTIVEAFAKGTPVVASRLGAMAELVDHGRTGLLFEAANAGELARRVAQLGTDADARRGMRRAARAEYERKYTGATNYRALRAVYERAIAAGGPVR